MNQTTKQTRVVRRGMITIELVFGLAIVMMLTASLATYSWHYQRGMSRIAHQREAIRLAEQAMAQLQSAGKVTLKEDETSIVVEPVECENVGSGRWVRVRVRYMDTEAQLIGVVPASALVGGEP